MWTEGTGRMWMWMEGTGRMWMWTDGTGRIWMWTDRKEGIGQARCESGAMGQDTAPKPLSAVKIDLARSQITVAGSLTVTESKADPCFMYGSDTDPHPE